ncbi:MAG: BlaI/MecI/CopY family transcriptional regulator [Actinomycetota bacterium]|nr:BlaI/MecI/CopY family transcriptional regulator [Actinomycetota bacterium]
MSEEPRREAGALEGEVLAALWSSADAMTPAAVLDQMGGTLAYTTVMTTLGRLYEKGLVERRRAGRGYAYLPIVREADLAANRFRALLDRGHDREAVLQGFVSKLSPEEANVLRALLASETYEAPR